MCKVLITTTLLQTPGSIVVAGKKLFFSDMDLLIFLDLREKLKKYIFIVTLLSFSAFAAQNDPALEAFSKGDNDEALRIFLPRANSGDSVSQFYAGFIYQYAKKNYPEAVRFYKMSAAKGDADSVFQLGSMNEHGQGFDVNLGSAVNYYRIAAKKGSANGQAALARMYLDGRGVPQDYMLAYMWANIGAGAGSKEATNLRELASRELGGGKILEAQRMARECIARNFSGCN